jgi:hypothetical protein
MTGWYFPAKDVVSVREPTENRRDYALWPVDAEGVNKCMDLNMLPTCIVQADH